MHPFAARAVILKCMELQHTQIVVIEESIKCDTILRFSAVVGVIGIG